MASQSMKLSQFVERGRLNLVLSGEIDSVRCACLEHFWRKHADKTLPELIVDMAGVDDIDPIGVATMINLLRDKLGDDTRVTLKSPPQVLAHTIYKSRMSQDPCLTMTDLRTEEPYAG